MGVRFDDGWPCISTKIPKSFVVHTNISFTPVIFSKGLISGRVHNISTAPASERQLMIEYFFRAMIPRYSPLKSILLIVSGVNSSFQSS